MQLQRRFISANAHFQLCHDTARIGTAYHFVQRYAGFRFTVNQRPVQRRTATVGRQQRAVQVKCAFCRHAQDVVAKQIAVVERENHVRREFLNAIHPQRMVHIVRGVNRNTVFSRNTRHRAEEVVFPGNIRMGEDGGNVEACVQQGLRARATHIVIGKDDGFHGWFSS